MVCCLKVINSGKKIMVSESEVFSVSGEEEKFVSKAMVTLMVTPVLQLK
jgi:acyl-coenzyme A thioesterase PaaI-like protein